MALINKIFWLAIVVEWVFIFVFHPENNIILLLKYTRVEFIYINLPLESHQKIGKTQKYLSVWKSFSTSCKSIGGRKKKEKISESKTTTLTYFDNLKKKQQDQGSISWVSLDEKGPSG